MGATLLMRAARRGLRSAQAGRERRGCRAGGKPLHQPGRNEHPDVGGGEEQDDRHDLQGQG